MPQMSETHANFPVLPCYRFLFSPASPKSRPLFKAWIPRPHIVKLSIHESLMSASFHLFSSVDHSPVLAFLGPGQVDPDAADEDSR